MKNINTKKNSLSKVLLAGIIVVLLATVGGVLFIGRASATIAHAHEQHIMHYCVDCDCADKHCFDCECSDVCSCIANCCSSDHINSAHRTSELRDYIRGGYSINDIRQMLGQQSIHQQKRVHTEYYGVVIYEKPFSESEITGMMQTMNGIVPMNTFVYTRERIYGIGRPLASSIVVVLMGDGYTQAQQADFMNHARSARDFMLGMHPFSLFRNRFVFYAVQTPSSATWVRTPENTTNRFRTYEPSSGRINIPQWGRDEVRAVANWTVGGAANLDMIQVIANTTRFGGVAWTAMHMSNLVVGISVTTRHTSSGGWHRTFVHEFGHSFGSLMDERNVTGQGSNGREMPNMTRNNNNVRWSHWIGHADIGQPRSINRYDGQWFVPRSYDTNWFGLNVTGGCIMALSDSSIHSFCAVCSAELTRRMAHMAGETFQSRHPNPGQTNAPTNTHVTMPANASRVVAYAFNGNTHLQEIRLGSGISHIGRYAFLGATGLRRIFVNSTFPPTVLDTAFAGINTNNVTVFVPVGTGARYRATAGWSQFTIVEKYSTTILADGSVSLNSVNYPMGANYVIPDRIPHVTFPTQNSASLSQRPVTQIGASAFAGNTNLSTITLPSTVTHIGNSAFVGSGVRHITIPSSVVSVGSFAFSGLSEEFRIAWHFNENLREQVGWTSFRDYIEELIIPNNVTSIPSHLFRNRTNLRIVRFASLTDSQLTGIGIGAFGGTSISQIDIPIRVNNIGHEAFDNTPLMTDGPANTVVYSGNAGSRWILGVRGQISDSYRPQAGTVGIGGRAFWNVPLSSVTLPSSIRYIGEYAFWNSAISRVSFEPGSNLRTIGNRAFLGANNLTGIRIPESVRHIGNSAFSGTALRTVYVERSAPDITTLGTGVFNNIPSLRAVYVPDSLSRDIYSTAANWSDFEPFIRLRTATSGLHFEDISCSWRNAYRVHRGTADLSGTLILPAFYNGIFVTEIADYSFADSPELERVIFEPGSWLERIGTRAFYNNINLTSVQGLPMHTTMSHIGDYAFAGNVSLSLNIPQTLSSIGRFAFRNVNLPADIYLPWTRIGFGAFYGNNTLERMTVAYVGETIDGTTWNTHFGWIFGSANGWWEQSELIPRSLRSVTVLGGVIGHGAFFAAYNLTSITLPHNITFIGTSAFENCFALESLKLPDTVTYIGSFAFINTGLTYISIPPNVIFIGDMAFAFCLGLRSVILPHGITALNWALFGGNNLDFLVIPSSVTLIVFEIFGWNGTVDKIYYGGSQEQWETLMNSMWDWNDQILYAPVFFYSPTPLHDGFHWRFVDHTPVMW